jgi:hypothetical protein
MGEASQPMTCSDGQGAARDLKIVDLKSIVGGVRNSETSNVTGLGFGSVSKQIPRAEGSSDGARQQHQESCNSECDSENNSEKPVAITSTSWKPESSSIPANSVMRSSSTRIPKDVFPEGFKLNTGMPMQHKSSESRSSKGIWSRAISDQRRTFSAEGIWFRPKIEAPRYRSRNLGGRRIKSVAPGTDPKPQWCPTGLTHTQKQRVQRLRAIEIKEEQKLGDLGFDKNKTMMSTRKVWRPKQVNVLTSDNENRSLVDGGSLSN